jgi:hypothetical protein
MNFRAGNLRSTAHTLGSGGIEFAAGMLGHDENLAH